MDEYIMIRNLRKEKAGHLPCGYMYKYFSYCMVGFG